MTALAPLNWRTRKRPSGSIGSALRPSTRRKAGAARTATTKAATTRGSPHPREGPLDEPVGEPGQEDDGQRSPGHVDVVGRSRVSGLGHVPGGEHEDAGGNRDVDEEDPSPRGDGQQVAPHERPGGRGHAGEARPGADGPGAVLVAERRLQDGQAARRQQGASHTLDDAGDHQQAPVGGETAGGRGDGEPGDADGEDAPPPEAVTEGAAEKEEGGQGERVARHHPLQGAHAAAEGTADGGKRDADDGGIERGDARTEDGGGEHPAPAGTAQDECDRRRFSGCRGGTRTAHCGQ